MPNLQIDGTTAKGQLVALLFSQDAVAASQTDVQLYAIETGATSSVLAVDEYSMPFAGEIIAIAYNLSAAGTTGTFTIGATVNGTENASTTQTVGTTVRGTARFKRGTAKFVAGDRLGVEITTGGTWDGINSDLVVIVYALVELDGI